METNSSNKNQMPNEKFRYSTTIPLLLSDTYNIIRFRSSRTKQLLFSAVEYIFLKHRPAFLIRMHHDSGFDIKNIFIYTIRIFWV